jgi:hypothetical protein
VHGASHGWRQLKLICDVSELIRRHSWMDLTPVVARAETLGIERMFFLGLRLAHDLLGAALSANVAQRVLTDPTVEVLTTQARGWLFGEHGGPSHLFEEAAFYVRLRERWRDRIPYALFYFRAYLRPAVVPTDKDRARLPLPASLSFLHYLLKPVRMVREYGLRPLGRVLRHLLKQLLEE